jgi:hypothetical protein
MIVRLSAHRFVGPYSTRLLLVKREQQGAGLTTLLLDADCAALGPPLDGIPSSPVATTIGYHAGSGMAASQATLSFALFTGVEWNGSECSGSFSTLAHGELETEEEVDASRQPGGSRRAQEKCPGTKQLKVQYTQQAESSSETAAEAIINANPWFANSMTLRATSRANLSLA